jgi:hypothetical protein
VVPAPTDQERAVQEHLVRLCTPMYRPVTQAAILSFATAGLVVGVGVGLLIADVPPRTIFGVTLAIVVAGLAIAWSFLLRRPTRKAMHLVMAHDLLERKAFERTTGGPMPRGEKAIHRWLAEHPGELEGFSVLVGLGRLDDAERLLDTADRTDADDWFQDARARALLALLRGEEPDIALLERRLGDLRDPDRYQHRSACLAIVRAQVAIDRGQSPIPVLAATEERVGAVGSLGEWATSIGAHAGFAFLAFALISLVAASRLP